MKSVILENQLLMPSSYVDVEKNEMEYIDGGISIKVNASLTTRAGALAVATNLCAKGKISWYNVLLIAKEIKGHAVAYYGLSGLSSLGISNSTLRSMKNSANPIDVVNGPDSRSYVVAACEVIWNFGL